MNSCFKAVLVLGLSAVAAFAQYVPPTVISALLNTYRGYSNLTSVATDAETYAVNITTWQMSHGGFSKAHETLYLSPWDGVADLSSWYSGTTPLGMYDNDATVSETRFLSNQYKVSTSSTNKTKFKDAVGKVVGFILVSQQASGSWPQVYPARTGATYSNLATYNDNAMIRLMVMIQDMVQGKAPFDSDIISAADKVKLSAALAKSVDFALKAQIVNGTTLTIWCQQHDPVTFAPAGARAYELPSKTASESVGVAAFLMNWPDQTAAVQAAVRGAVQWYTNTRVAGLKWVAPDFVTSVGASMWYRYYNVEDNQYFFSDRDGSKYFDITLVSAERRNGYQWGGDYGSKLITAAAQYNPPAVSSSSSAASSSSAVSSSSAIVASSSSVDLTVGIFKHGSGPSSQTITSGDSIVGFWFSWENAPDISVTDVPAGISVVIDTVAKSVTFSGVVTASSGSYTYTLATVGGTSVATKSGTITVTGSPVAIHQRKVDLLRSNSVSGVGVDARGRIRWLERGNKSQVGIYWMQQN